MAEKTSLNLEENIASVLCYVLVWVTGIIFFFLEKENKTVRFHAMQSILTFLPLTILSSIFSWIGSPKWTGSVGPYGAYGWDPGIPALLWLSWIISIITFILWLFLMYKAYQGEKFKVPIVGDIAEKQVK
jgi:uncharacterized membrane protein